MLLYKFIPSAEPDRKFNQAQFRFYYDYKLCEEWKRTKIFKFLEAARTLTIERKWAKMAVMGFAARNVKYLQWPGRPGNDLTNSLSREVAPLKLISEIISSALSFSAPFRRCTEGEVISIKASHFRAREMFADIYIKS